VSFDDCCCWIICASLSVVDGDTVKCDGQNMLLLGEGVPYVSGIDTPEIGSHAKCINERKLALIADTPNAPAKQTKKATRQIMFMRLSRQSLCVLPLALAADGPQYFNHLTSTERMVKKSVRSSSRKGSPGHGVQPAPTLKLARSERGFLALAPQLIFSQCRRVGTAPSLA
jgi:hypothetical protein